jgi:hypothetical protein
MVVINVWVFEVFGIGWDQWVSREYGTLLQVKFQFWFTFAGSNSMTMDGKWELEWVAWWRMNWETLDTQPKLFSVQRELSLSWFGRRANRKPCFRGRRQGLISSTHTFILCSLLQHSIQRWIWDLGFAPLLHLPSTIASTVPERGKKRASHLSLVSTDYYCFLMGPGWSE